MGKCPDLIGMKFGKLLVVSKAESTKDNNSQWNCVCDCGNTCVVRGRSLRTGKRMDCGCETVRFYDLTGERFGRLIVECKEPHSGDGKTRWRCRCDCGSTIVAESRSLRDGRKTDCGCVNPNKRGGAELIDLTGQVFYALTVLEKAPPQRDRRTRWLCKCDCGNIYVTTSQALRKGLAKSCGCGRMKNIAGQRFGMLTAIERSDQYIKRKDGTKRYKWKCVCDCGEIVYRLPEKLREDSGFACDNCNSQKAVNAMLENAGFVEGTQISKILSDKPTLANKSGHRGVFLNNRTQKWRATLKFRGVNHYLGEYADLGDAVRARKRAEEKYFEPFLEMYVRE